MSGADTKRRGLGRGLSALLGEDTPDFGTPERPRTPQAVPVECLRPGRFQPRRHMAEDDLDELAQSIARHGVLQPILVRRIPDEPAVFEIIAGERRWRAAQRAQLHDVPVLVRDVDDRVAFQVALIENLQRQDLSALEEAEGYRRLIEEYEHSQEDIAQAIGKSRSHVANTIRLLGLPAPVRSLLESGALSAGHARALLTAKDPEALARQVVERGLNVRQTEQLANDARGDGHGPKPRRAASPKDPDTLALERDLANLLGLSVEIRFRGGGGQLVLNYGSLDQLDDILHRLSRGTHGRQTEAVPVALRSPEQ